MLSKAELASILCCTRCKRALEVHEDSLQCTFCKRSHPLREGVWCFLSGDHYTQSFGFQWQKHARTQIDRFNGLSISHERFFRQTQWNADDLRDRRVFEVGSGAGRFTEVALETGARVFSVEPSAAIFVNARNNPSERLALLQASLYDLPFSGECFDYLFCFGVIQHTPNVAESFRALFKHLKKGGRFCIDVYASPIAWLHPRHLLRPITRRMEPEKLYGMVERWVSRLLPISHAVNQIPLVGEIAGRLIPIANWERSLPLTSPVQKMEWSILDTFDWYSPKYENPQSRKTLQNWCEALHLHKFEIKRYRGVYVVRGEK